MSQMLSQWYSHTGSQVVPSHCIYFNFIHGHNPYKEEDNIVSYLTQVSDLDLAPDPEQFVASTPVRFIELCI